MTSLHDPEAADPPISEYSTAELGALLRESRVSLGRELEDVAAELRIRLVYLQAIEEGRLEELPGVAYATGFLRAYGDFLGLDGDDLVRRFKAAGMSTTQSTDLQLPSPVEEGRLPTGSVLLVAALLAVGAYGGWYYMSSQGRDPIDNVSAIPDQIAELVGIDGKQRQAAESGGAATAEPNATDSETSDVASMSGGNADGSEIPLPAPDPAAGADPSASQSPEAATQVAEAVTAPAVESAAPAREAADETQPPPAPEAEPRPAREAESSPSVAAATDETPAQPPPTGDSTATTPNPPSVVETAKVALPPIPPKRKPVLEARAPETSLEAAETPETSDTSAPAASTIVAAAAGGERNTPPDAPPAAPSPAESTPPVMSHRVVLRANTDTWVEIGAAEEAPVLSRLLRQGETFVVPPRRGLMMATGNAGGIEILVDGKAVAMLGPVGQVRKNVALDAESLLDGRHVTR